MAQVEGRHRRTAQRRQIHAVQHAGAFHETDSLEGLVFACLEALFSATATEKVRSFLLVVLASSERFPKWEDAEVV